MNALDWCRAHKKQLTFKHPWTNSFFDITRSWLMSNSVKIIFILFSIISSVWFFKLYKFNMAWEVKRKNFCVSEARRKICKIGRIWSYFQKFPQLSWFDWTIIIDIIDVEHPFKPVSQVSSRWYCQCQDKLGKVYLTRTWLDP